MKITTLSLTAGALLFLAGCQPGAKFQETKMGQFTLLEQKGGPTLGYSPSSGVKLIEKDGFKFKDLNRNGKLDKYEDSRLTFTQRAADLAAQLSDEEIAGLRI